MAITQTIIRPKTAVTENESSAQSFATHEADPVFYLDWTATVNSALRLLGRYKYTPEVAGQNQRFKIEFLDFSSTADQTFSAGQVTTPFTDAEADSTTLVGYSPYVDMHALYVTAGDTTSS